MFKSCNSNWLGNIIPFVWPTFTLYISVRYNYMSVVIFVLSKKSKLRDCCLHSWMCSCHGKLTLSFFEFLALLTVSEEVRSRCSLKHRKSLLLTDVSMENVPMDTYPIHHSDTSYRLVVWLLDKISVSLSFSKLSKGNL